MNPVHHPKNEPDPDDMLTKFDSEAETGAPANTPSAGKEEADAIGDFA